MSKLELEIEAARRGFRTAIEEGFQSVNRTPYGPAWPGQEDLFPEAHAWYTGFWFGLDLRKVLGKGIIGPVQND